MSVPHHYEISADAARDLAEIEDYIYSYTEDWDFVDARIDEFLDLFDRLCEMPFAHPVYQFPHGFEPSHEYRSANVYHYKVFYRVCDAGEQPPESEAGPSPDEGGLQKSQARILIYRICHEVSDFTAAEF